MIQKEVVVGSMYIRGFKSLRVCKKSHTQRKGSVSSIEVQLDGIRVLKRYNVTVFIHSSALVVPHIDT